MSEGKQKHVYNRPLPSQYITTFRHFGRSPSGMFHIALASLVSRVNQHKYMFTQCID